MTTDTLVHHRLERTEALAPQIHRLWLARQHPFSYQAGDYIMLGFNESELKPFSIANAPQQDGLLELHIRNDPNSPWMQSLFALNAGATLFSSPAKSQMTLHPEADLNLFIAGGTGLAPMKALLEARIQQGLTRPTKLYMGARHAEELYLHDHLMQLAQQTPLLDYIEVVSEVPDYPGLQGLVHEVALAQNPNLSQVHVYVCGAWAMVKKAQDDFIAAGLNARHFTH